MEHLILLHGALGSAQQVAPLIPLLEANYHVHTIDLDGHGARAGEEVEFSMARFAQTILEYLGQRQVEKTHVFGYSMGGYAALTAALQQPQLFGRMVTLATKFNWTPETAAKEVRMLDATTILEKVPRFAQLLKQRHGEDHWKTMLERTAALMQDLGNDPVLTTERLGSINVPVQVSIGSADRMVSVKESKWAADALPNGKLLTVPDMEHPFEKADPEAVAKMIKDFMG